MGAVAKIIGGIGALVVLVALIGEIQDRPEFDEQGLPARDWSWRAEIMATRQIRERLRDPESAQFRSVRVYRQADPMTRAVCGEVNAKNGYGGYVGFQPFVVAVTYVSRASNGDITFNILPFIGSDQEPRPVVNAVMAERCVDGGGPVARPSSQLAPAPSGQNRTEPISQPSTFIGYRMARMKQNGNVRSSASPNASVVRTIAQNVEVRIFAQNGAWYEVGDSHPWGWVHNSLLDIR